MQARLAVQQVRGRSGRAPWSSSSSGRSTNCTCAPAFAGVLQIVPVEVGQQVAPGTNLARVADPSRLKAELKIAETQAKDIQIGQLATIDTRNGIVAGKVVRIDPSVQNGTVTVDVAMDGPLPRGARPDLSVDGTVELERLADVIYVGRPAFGQEQSAVGLFKLQPNGEATRVQVKLGRSSVNTVEVVSGLNRRRPGDSVGHVRLGRVRSHSTAIGCRDDAIDTDAARHQARRCHEGVRDRRSRNARARRVWTSRSPAVSTSRLPDRPAAASRRCCRFSACSIRRRGVVPAERPAGRRAEGLRSGRASATARSASSSRAST